MKFVKVKDFNINIDEILYIKRMFNKDKISNRMDYFFTVVFKSGQWVDISLEEYLILENIVYKNSFEDAEA